MFFDAGRRWPEAAWARLAVLATLALFWLNYLFTARWAEVPGALHGEKKWWFVASLSLTTALALLPRRETDIRLRRVAIVSGLSGIVLLACAFFSWFPPDTWHRVPFLDNWPPRYQSTVDGIALLRKGAVVGWQWAFLGGYHLSSDVTVSLAVPGWIPIIILGNELGFHVLHLLLFAAIPLLVWLDLRKDEDPDSKWVAMGLAGFLAASYSYALVGAGDTNSLAGVVATFLALFAARLMKRSRWGGPLLVFALSLIIYSHAGFLLFAFCYLGLHLLLERNLRHSASVALACLGALIVGLPLTLESFVYPAYFTPNNAVLEPPPFNWVDFARQVYYNVELLALPGRWLNDYRGLANAALPMLAFVAIRARGRARFHACAALLTIAMTRLYVPEYLGWGMIRAAHMQPVFLAAAIGWFVVALGKNLPLAVSLLVTLALYVQVTFASVPHVRNVRDFDAALVDRVAAAGGALVLVENSYHPEMDGDPSTLMERTPFPAHFEALLASATGRRFYAGVWDGWQWAPARRHLLANGALGGRRLDLLTDAELLGELRRWGVTELFVWSQMAIKRLSDSPAFAAEWQHGRWRQFRVRDPDPRSVVTASGAGELKHFDPLSAVVQLTSVRAGDLVVIRTNYYPVWRASSGDRDIPTFNAGGQLAFHAPATGDYLVTLAYPRRTWLVVLALLGGSSAAVYLWRVGVRVQSAASHRDDR